MRSLINAYILLIIMAIILLLIAYRQGNHVEGLKEAKNLFINVLPMLICAFVIVGFISVLIPREMLQNLLGAEAGLKGLAIGTAIGALFQGGPFAFLPFFNAVFKDTISVGTAVAMISAWGMINIGHLPYEFTFLGPRFVALKYCMYLTVPILTGLIANLLFG